MEQKLPYYMMYPTPFLFADDKKEERDYEYLKSMYPDAAKKIIPYVEDECDRMEYEGSMIYDEYPDKLQLRLMCSRICEAVRANEELSELSESSLETAQLFRSRRKPDHTRELVELLLYQELMRRRSSHRRNRRRVY